jgi:hypothetical protein
MLSGMEQKRLRDALVGAFPTFDDFGQLVQYGLNVPPGVIYSNAVNLPAAAWQTIGWTEARGVTLALVAAALNERPRHQVLRQMAEALSVDDGAGQFERIVFDRLHFNDPETWRNLMIGSEHTVCRVEVASAPGEENIALGTGFLVSDDLAITCYHVVEDFFRPREDARWSDPKRLRFHFDYRQREHEVIKGPQFSLADESLVEHSPVNNLDFALLRLNEEAGKQTLGSPAAPTRGYLKRFSNHVAPEEPLIIVQHPKADPLKFAFGSVSAIDTPASRVCYRVNTLPGSSGSPCFDADWSIVALHQRGSEAAPNEGILFASILAYLSNKAIRLTDNG